MSDPQRRDYAKLIRRDEMIRMQPRQAAPRWDYDAAQGKAEDALYRAVAGITLLLMAGLLAASWLGVWTL